MTQVSVTLFVAKSITEMVPSRRLLMYSDLASLETCRPCVLAPVGMKLTSSMATWSMTDTPMRPWFAT